MSSTKLPCTIYRRGANNSYQVVETFPADASGDDINRKFLQVVGEDRAANLQAGLHSDFLLVRGEILDSSYRGIR